MYVILANRSHVYNKHAGGPLESVMLQWQRFLQEISHLTVAR